MITGPRPWRMRRRGTFPPWPSELLNALLAAPDPDEAIARALHWTHGVLCNMAAQPTSWPLAWGCSDPEGRLEWAMAQHTVLTFRAGIQAAQRLQAPLRPLAPGSSDPLPVPPPQPEQRPRLQLVPPPDDPPDPGDAA